MEDFDARAPRWLLEGSYPEHTADEILPGLHMGGTADDDTVDLPAQLQELRAECDFDVVLTLYGFAQPFQWGVEELRYGFADSDMESVDVTRVVRLAAYVHERWTSGERVLIRCQAGLNRSALVAALVLMIDGHEPAAAIDRLREQRSVFVLCNRAFERWLLEEAADALADHRSSPDA